jgi:hypothetical protein
LIEDDDRLNRMAEKYLNTVFDNLAQVDTKFGSGYKFNDDEGYAILVFKTHDGKQLAISSPLIQGVTPMLNGLLDLDKRGIAKTIGKYCREVLGIDYDYLRVWPIKIKGPDEDVISEVNRVEDFDEDYPDYNYTAVGVSPRTTNPNEIGVVFFNGTDFGKSEYRNPEGDRMVYFIGPLGEFEFDSRDVHYNGKSPFVFGNKLKNSYYDKLLPLMKSNKTSSSPTDFTSDEVRESIKMAFPEYWEDENDDYTAGIRGIHTIGEKTDTDVDWSIMNFFDTKREVKELINKKWDNEGSGNKIEWLSSVLKNDEGFLNKLLSIQWNSIKGGFENELKALKNLTEMLKKAGVEFEYDIYPPGHKKDRYDSIDLTLKIQGEEPMTLQIKPVTKTEKMPNGNIKVYTYGMTNNYKRKDGLGFIIYNKGNSFIIFKNKNYYVTPTSNGTQVIHKDKPFKVYKG